MNFRHMESCSHIDGTGALGGKSKKAQSAWKLENILRFLPTSSRKGERRKNNSYKFSVGIQKDRHMFLTAFGSY